ncbi:MAG: hypothetical protein GPJ54_16010, partial [Candidatus Heimdallarchaeota archaeon]|nr:hypothetical protein [Candidatus Heimdallarchaeota archaeon]
SQNALLDLVLIHSTMLSIFFWTMHYQYILWLYPWAIFNSIDKGKKELSIPILLTIAFPFRYREYNLPNTSIPFVPGNIILFITGALILYWTLTQWKSRSINDR